MKRRLTTAPTTTAVSLAEAKARAIIESTDDDAVVTSLIKEAEDWAEQYLSRHIMPQTWTYYFDTFPAVMCLESNNITGVVIKYDDETNAEQTLAASSYHLDEIAWPAVIIPVQNWPTTYSKPNAVRVEVTAGYVDADSVPGAIKAGMYLMIGHLYNNRESTAPIKMDKVPFGAESFLDKYRIIL